MLDHVQCILIHRPNVLGFYSTSLHCHHQTHPQLSIVSTLAQPLGSSGVISNCPPLLPSSILDTFQLEGLIFWCHIFLPFHTVYGVLAARILEWFAISSCSGPRFVRPLTTTCPSWVSLNSMAHSFIGLRKTFHHDNAVIFKGLSLKISDHAGLAYY